MKALFLDSNFTYFGSELRSLFLYEKGLKVSSGLLSWIGPCEVSTEALVDQADRENSDLIFSEKMVHFIGEFFHRDVFYGIMVQRLMAEIVKTYLNEKCESHEFKRVGDDLYCESKKLNVSIATVSPLSSLLHFGVNVSSKNTPVEAIGLEDLKIDPFCFAKDILALTKSEIESIESASVKVHTVN